MTASGSRRKDCRSRRGRQRQRSERSWRAGMPWCGRSANRRSFAGTPMPNRSPRAGHLKWRTAFRIRNTPYGLCPQPRERRRHCHALRRHDGTTWTTVQATFALWLSGQGHVYLDSARVSVPNSCWDVFERSSRPLVTPFFSSRVFLPLPRPGLHPQAPNRATAPHGLYHRFTAPHCVELRNIAWFETRTHYASVTLTAWPAGPNPDERNNLRC